MVHLEELTALRVEAGCGGARVREWMGGGFGVSGDG